MSLVDSVFGKYHTGSNLSQMLFMKNLLCNLGGMRRISSLNQCQPVKFHYCAVMLTWLIAGVISSNAQSTAFTYQGRLNDAQGPANGSYDFHFTLFDSNTNGNQQGLTCTNTATAVSNGLFIVTLDFGNQFPGEDRWMEIAVCTNGSGNFITLSPRQPITATPYAVKAASVAPGGIPSGVYTNAVIFSNVGNQFAGNGAGLTNLAASKITGLGSLAFSNTVNLPANVVTNLQTTTIYRLCMFETGYGYNNPTYNTNGVEMFAGTSPTNLVLTANAPVYQDPNNIINIRDPDHFKYTDNNGNTTYIMAYTTHYGDDVASATPGYGVAVSPDDFTWTFLGYVPYPSWAIWSPKHFVDATNGLHVIFLSGSTDEDSQPDSYTIADVNPLNFLQVTNFRNLKVFDNYTPGGACIKYINGQYYFFSGNGAESANTALTAGGWNVINYDTGMQNGSTVVNYQGLWYWFNTFPNVAYITSPDLTNWSPNPIEVDVDGASGDGTFIAMEVANTGNGLGLTPQNYLTATGASPFDASGLTNLSASQLTGTLPTAVLPGITTNISAAGITFYITNGLIMRVSTP